MAVSCGPPEGGRPFFRSYGAGLPSSLTRFLSRALVHWHHPTCVGLRYGRCMVGGTVFLGGTIPLVGLGRSLALGPPSGRRRRKMDPRRPAMPMRRLGNVGPTSIGYAFRPGLRTRLTPGGRTWPGKPWDSGGGDFNPPFRYSCPHNRSRQVHGRFPSRFDPGATLPYQSLDSAAPADGLTPDHFRRGIARPVSCYALFKWWLPLSQHPGCPCGPTSLVTEPSLGGLCRRSGLFPSRRRNLSPVVSLPG